MEGQVKLAFSESDTNVRPHWESWLRAPRPPSSFSTACFVLMPRGFVHTCGPLSSHVDHPSSTHIPLSSCLWCLLVLVCVFWWYVPPIESWIWGKGLCRA